ncbi:MAG: 4Fe-4S ferredoxin [Spirochaetes bacterium GWF1_51_8]|nr:MAG: 4Fe-4S ferredoxin [Spirochaetes bacterium GWF1_51_8]
MASKVWFTNLRSSGKSLLAKLDTLLRAAGMMTIDFNKKFTAIKIHFGEPGNLAYIRPNYARVVSKMVREAGGYPFLTDSNTLYKGRRANAVDHLEAAFENGFNPMVTDCPVIIADGLKGTEYREIEIGLKYCKTAKIGAAIANADIVISMNHFKGHEMTGFGGALKNLGMGSGSIGGKLEMHSQSKPKIVREKCTGCKKCAVNCAQNAIRIDGERKAVIDYQLCVGCGQCIAVCRFDSAVTNWDAGGDDVSKKMAEYAFAVVSGKPNFHINFVMDVSPDCDCWGSNDAALIPNLGILASFDPVALDQACADMTLAAPLLDGTVIQERHPGHQGTGNGEDKFHFAHPSTDWRIQLQHAEEIGLGTRAYETINLG